MTTSVLCACNPSDLQAKFSVPTSSESTENTEASPIATTPSSPQPDVNSEAAFNETQSPQQSDSAEKYVEQGNTLLAQCKTEEALSSLNKAIELDPKNAMAYGKLGVAYINQGNYQEALSSLSKAIERDPKLASAYGNRGSAYNELGRYEEAFADFNAALERDPKLASAYNNRGLTFYHTGNYQKAMADFNIAIELIVEGEIAGCQQGDEPHPISFAAIVYNNRGSLLNSLSRYQEAWEDLTTAIDLDLKLALPYNNRGFTYLNTGSAQKALEDFNTAIELNSEYPIPYFNRGLVYVRNGYKQDATKDFQRAAEMCEGKETADCRQLQDAFEGIR